MIMFYIYLMMQADTIISVIGGMLKMSMLIWLAGSLVLGLWGTGAFNNYNASREEDQIHQAKGWAAFKLFQKILIPSLIILCFLKAFFPSTKTVAVVVGTSVVYNAVTSETGQRLGNKAVEYLEYKINEAMTIMDEPKKEEVQ